MQIKEKLYRIKPLKWKTCLKGYIATTDLPKGYYYTELICENKYHWGFNDSNDENAMQRYHCKSLEKGMKAAEKHWINTNRINLIEVRN